MGETKFTPGPWHASCHDVIGKRAIGDSGVRFWSVTPEGKYRGDVANVGSAEHIGGIKLGERDANAHLIAAAPDLYEALEAADKALWAEGYTVADPTVVKIAAALTKARGEQ